MKLSLAATAALVVVFGVACRETPTGPTTPVTNRPPRIESFILEPATVTAGTRYSISFSASFERQESVRITLTAKGDGWDEVLTTEFFVNWYVDGRWDIASWHSNPYASKSGTLTLRVSDAYGSATATRTLTVTP